jgi:hypothetical protein
MAKKYGVASDYIKYTSRIKSDTSDGVAVEASQVVDLEEDKLQSDINKELKASIASASGKTYSKSEIDGKDTATLTSAKSYADTKKTEAVSAAATDATTKANSALASAKSYADQKVSALGSVYTTKGSCTAAQLKALTSAKAGDVWNITDAITIDGKAYPAGVNVVCVTAFAGTIDPATTRIWDALQGLQDLTSYAKWSQVEEAAISDVEFERDVAGEDNSYTFKKTLTYVGGTKREVDFGIILDPATSTKAGVMSAADKVKLDAVDGRIQDVKIVKDTANTEVGYKITDLNGKNSVLIRSGAQIWDGVSIGTGAYIQDGAGIGYRVQIQEGINIGTTADNAFEISNSNDRNARVGIYYGAKIFTDALIGTNVKIGSNIEIGTHGESDTIIVRGIDLDNKIGFGLNSGDFKWKWENGVKTAATTDDLSALASRVSALEDLLKLA